MDEQRKERMCGNKVPYPNRRSAERAIRHRRKHDGPQFAGLNAYDCPHCSNWHIGRNPQVAL